MYLWGVLCALYVHACQVRVTAGGLGSLLLCLCGLLSANQLPLCVDTNNRSIYHAQKLVCRNCSKRTHTRIHRHSCMHSHTHTHTQILRQQPYNLHRLHTKSKQLSKSQDSPTPASHSHMHTHTHTQPGETKGRVGERERLYKHNSFGFPL